MKRTIGGLVTALVLSAGAQAAPISTQQSLNFSAGSQSLFGPGSGSAGFRTNGMVGTNALGFSWDIGASSGRVDSAGFGGRIDYRYDNEVFVDAADRVTFDFQGIPGGSRFATSFGAGIETNWHVLGLTGCIYCVGETLRVNTSRTSGLDTPHTGSDRATAAGVEVGPNILVASATAGVDVDVIQRSTFEATGIRGTLTATNRATGAMRQQSLSIANNAPFTVDLGLDEVGIWDVAMTGLTLSNSFFSSFTAALTPFVQYTVGVFCGDPSTDADNGFGCADDGRADWDLANLNLGTTQRFGLSFNQLNLNPFSISVLAPQAVPGPSALVLLGMGALVLLRRRRLG